MGNKKCSVGIITFHRAHNYGAVLQCLALKVICEKLGYKTIVIDHRNSKIEEKYSINYSPNKNLNWMRFLKGYFKHLLLYPTLKRKHHRFNSFIQQYLLSNIDSSSPVCLDAIIWGSDQIWRKDIIGNDPVFFGNIDIETGRKIVYAGSMGKVDESIESEIDSIRKFDAISVREVELSTLLQMKGISSRMVLDPTLLLTGTDWNNLLPLKPKNRSYLLVYAMRNRDAVMEIAKLVATQTNLPIVELYSDIGVNNYNKPYSASSPIEFVSLFSGADFIVTDSFHGTSFSIIFNKPFYTVKLDDGNDNRAESLLKNLGLHSQMVQAQPDVSTEIDYNLVNQKLERMRKESIRFLIDNLPVN